MTHIIRSVRQDDWTRAKALRLDALRDPIAHLAFLDTYEQAAARPDEFWQDRAAGAAEGRTSRQFVAEAADGRWLGTVSVLVERSGTETFFGDVPEVSQTHIVGVFVRPEARGTGLTQELFRAALAWSWSLAEPRIDRVRLFVHEDNPRAEALYAKVGFKRTGFSISAAKQPTSSEIELALLRA
ncbi:GNAT family N-acetyltransferase [Kitasatospora sp. NBC_01287]|uniref:GNAT family N-acetyltransferase n=1 Tax=Kitasatospora sp. NBC_01287 TaxID=2903573 RepID=UPI00225240DB|nr:GNAT family N-acetyltransferase [Kitasatospora sp. NBC_01287]MCX4747301.1 GNAT family N-acetyltransferase [Kitasatospora sp. NBC_01287]